MRKFIGTLGVLAVAAAFAGGQQGGRPGGPQGGPPGGPPRPGQVLPGFLQERLKLTGEQKKQIEELQKEVDARLAKILTDEQKKMLQEMPKGGRPPGDRGQPGDRRQPPGEQGKGPGGRPGERE